MLRSLLQPYAVIWTKYIRACRAFFLFKIVLISTWLWWHSRHMWPVCMYGLSLSQFIVIQNNLRFNELIVFFLFILCHTAALLCLALQLGIILLESKKYHLTTAERSRQPSSSSMFFPDIGTFCLDAQFICLSPADRNTPDMRSIF